MDSRARMSIARQFSEDHHSSRASTFVISIHNILVCVTKGKLIRYGGLLPVPIVGSVRVLDSKSFEKLFL